MAMESFANPRRFKNDKSAAQRIDLRLRRIEEATSEKGRARVTARLSGLTERG